MLRVMPTDEEKQKLAMEKHWPVSVVAEYFDIPEAEVRRLGGGQEHETVDRFHIEKKLAVEGLIGLDWLALDYGVPRAELEKAMRQPPNGLPPFPLDMYPKDQHGRILLSKNFAEAWVEELLPKNKVWSSLDTRARDLANRIGGGLRECAVSKRFSEAPPAVATCRCIVTWDGISLAHQEYLDNGKSISLEPDHVGWHAIFDGKISVENLWQPALVNYRRYLEEQGVPWSI